MYIFREHNFSMALNFKVTVVLEKEKIIFEFYLQKFFQVVVLGTWISLLSFGGAVLSGFFSL